MIDNLELMIQSKLSQAVEKGLEVARATSSLVTARVKENVEEIKVKIKEAGLGMDAPSSPTEEEEVWVTENSSKKPRVEEQIDIWTNPVDFWIFGEERETTVTFSLVDAWRREKAAGAAVTTVQHLVHYMIYAGKLSPNLGFGNALFKDEKDWFLGEVYMNVKGKHMRRNELLRNPLFDYWPQISAPDAKPAIGFIRIHERKDILSFMATWDEEEEALDAEADEAWKEEQADAAREAQEEEQAGAQASGDFHDAMEGNEQVLEMESDMQMENKSSGSKRKADDTVTQPGNDEDDLNAEN